MEDENDVTQDRQEDTGPAIGFPELWRRYGVLAAAAAVVIVIVGGYALFKLAPPRAPDLGTPEATVRLLVGLLRASDTETKTYEPFFVDQIVAGAIAQSVRRGTFPKALDIDAIKAETGSDTATVTVKWTIRRPNVKENGSVFFLKLQSARWRIVDAQPKQVDSGAKSPKSKEGTAGP